jgi:hypothetical protein
MVSQKSLRFLTLSSVPDERRFIFMAQLAHFRTR